MADSRRTLEKRVIEVAREVVLADAAKDTYLAEGAYTRSRDNEFKRNAAIYRLGLALAALDDAS